MSDKVKPPRTVGAIGTSLFQINGMIGAGIFALPAMLVAAVGSFAPAMIVIGAILILPTCFVFAWLATRFEETGGPVLYGKTAFGSFAGFHAGWGRYASGIVAMGANTHVMVSYIAALFPPLQIPWIASVASFAILVLSTLYIFLGMRSSVNALGLLTAFKLVPLAILVLAAVFGNYNAPAIVLPEFTKAETVILLTFYAFIGFEGVVVPAGELNNPRRDLPRVILLALAGVTLAYVAVIWAYMAIVSEPTGNANALAGAASIAFGEVGAIMIVLAASFSIMANNFAGMVVVPRLAYGMAEQGMLPAWFEQIHPRFLTPANSIMFYGFAGALFSLSGGFAALASASTLTRLLTYMISAGAVPTIAIREGKINGCHLGLAIPSLASCVWIAFQASAQSWLTFGGLFIFGTILFLCARRNSAFAPDAA